jgi:hypothetical protein
MFVPLNRPRHLPFKFNSKINYKFKDFLHVWPFHISLIALPSKVHTPRLSLFGLDTVRPPAAGKLSAPLLRALGVTASVFAPGTCSPVSCSDYSLSVQPDVVYVGNVTQCLLVQVFAFTLTASLPISHNHTSFKYRCYTIIAIGSVFK